MLKLNSLRRTKIIAISVVIYMLLAISWWSILLYQQNRELYYAQIERIQTENLISPNPNAEILIQEQRDKQWRQEIMIISEGLVFGIMLVIGILLMLKAFKRELEIARLRNNFMLSVTHELKSPIASIKLILETFQKRSLDKMQLEEFTGHALEEAERLERLVDNVLFANKMNHNYHFNFELTDINEIIKRVIYSFSKNFPDFDFTFESQKNFSIKMDPLAIEIVIRNIVDNAIKYSKDIKKIELSLQEENSEIILAIKDYGIGIPKKERALIFYKFYRIEDEETRATQGTGLGLYLAYKVMKSHNGVIKILDNPSGGSIFHLSFKNG